VNTRIYALMLILFSALALGACGGGGGDDSTPPVSDQPDDTNDTDDSDDTVTLEVPETYTFPNPDEVETVNYTGQTKRHILIDDLVAEMNGLEDDPGKTPQEVIDQLDFYYRFDSDSSDNNTTLFNARDLGGNAILPEDSGELTYGAIASGKDLIGKTAGQDQPDHLIGGEFFGWEGIEDPVEMVDYFFEQLAQEATDGETPQIETVDGTVPLDTVTVDAQGLDYRQLVQKFLLGAVAFNQGTTDYLQTDFANTLTQEDDEPFTSAEHDWDEAFGYFGAARDYDQYTDDEIRNIGFKDSNPEDGAIDIRSEFNFGNSVNCAKRDAGAVNDPNFTQQAFDAFIQGRTILRQASLDGELTEDQQEELSEHIKTAAVTWEKCVAATVVHYINDLNADMDEFQDGQFASLENFRNMAKHFGEMKGFALGLQFSIESPFRESEEDLQDLKEILSLMGDAPVLADGTQGGEPFEGGLDQYRADLLQARDLLEEAYDFDDENVENW